MVRLSHTPRADRAQASADVASECLHCGLPLARTRFGERGEFCCRGCMTVNQLLVAEGLERYYDLRGRTEAPVADLSTDSFAWLEALTPASGPDGTQRLTLDVQGVHCAACVWLLEELWRREPGGVELCINPTLGRAEVAWRSAECDLREYLRGVERFGYRFGPPRKQDPKTSRGLVLRLGVCAAAAANVMIFSLCYYAGLTREDHALYVLFGALSFALATLAVLVGGTLFFSSAVQAIRRRVAHLDLPIALGILLGYLGSVWAWLARGPEAAYFDTITVFVTLMVLGRSLQERVLQKNRLALLASHGVEDLFTRRRTGNALETIPAARVRPNDEIWVLPGDVVPVAGTLLGEPAAMSLDWIDGESRPRTFEPGELVPAGAFHTGDAPARLVAREDFAQSRLATLLGEGRPDDRRAARSGRGDAWSGAVARWYVTGVLVLAAIAFAAWWPWGLDRAIEVALSVLVITCPCALGLATPLANELAHTSLRRRGVFLRDAGLLRRVLRVKHVLFDKTGTLTRSVLAPTPTSLTALLALDAESKAVLRDATARSLHPVSRAIASSLSRSGPVELVEGVATREIAGEGIEIRRGGITWRLGRAGFALGREDLQTETCFTRDGRLLATLEFEEELKGDARDEVRALVEEGLSIHLLSGDRIARARRIGTELGIPLERIHGELSPEDKAGLLRGLDHQDTWMIGDGINDGPAFDAAWCAATPAVDRPSLPARSDLYFLGDGIVAVRATFSTARRLSSVLRTNLMLAVGYNLAAVTACLLGLIGPLAAAILMPASSLGLLALTSARLSGRRTAWTS